MTARHNSARVCRQFKQDLVLYYYGECGQTERDKVESHLSGCRECRRFLEDLRSFLPMAAGEDAPPRGFWESYSREMRAKLTAAEQKPAWWEALVALFRPWPVPAAATAVILALAMTLTFTKGPWRSNESDPQEKELMEIARAGENLEFFRSLDFLDSMDLLESVEGKELKENETGHRAL